MSRIANVGVRLTVDLPEAAKNTDDEQIVGALVEAIESTGIIVRKVVYKKETYELTE